MQSTDAGVTWQLTEVPIRLAGTWFRGIALGPDARGFIVGNRGIVLATQRDTFHEVERGGTAGGRVDQEG
jgi:photosystem II stability/assembly factor-like uncharacterized protein